MQSMRSTVEQSALSRSSVDQGSSEGRKLLASAKGGIIDRLFPFFDHLSQDVHFPTLIYNIALLIFAVQSSMVSFWVFGEPEAWDVSDLGCKVPAALASAVWLVNFPTQELNPIIPFLIYVVVFVLTIGVVLAEMTIYWLKRRFIAGAMFYICQIIFEFLDMITLIPCGAFCGNLFSVCWASPTTTNVAILVVSCFLYVFFLGFFAIHFLLICYSPYIPRQPYASWLPSGVLGYMIGSSLFACFSYIFPLVESWTIIVLIVIHMAYLCWICFEMSFLPTVYLGPGTVLFGQCVASLATDLLVIVGKWVSGVRGWPVLAVHIVLLILASVIYHVVMSKRIKKFIELMMYSKKESELTEDEKREMYEALRVDRSFRHAYFVMKVGLLRGTKMFLDLSIVKRIIEMDCSTDVLMMCMRFMVLFPGEARIVNVMFGLATRRRDLSLGHRFMIYQVNRIKTLRTSSSSSEATERLQELIQTRHRNTDIIHEFWTNIPSSTYAFTRLIDSVNRATVLWEEAIKDFPNSSRICDEYSLFLIDCASDFQRGIKLKSRSDLIDSGKNYSVDMAFRSLIRTYPDYVKKQLVTISGYIVHEQKGGGSATASSTGGGSSFSSATASDIDMEMEERIGQSLFSASRMRLALQRAFQSRHSKHAKQLKWHIFIAFLIHICCFVVMFVFGMSWFESAQESLTRQHVGSQARFSASVATLCLAYEWAVFEGKFDRKSSLVNLATGETEGDNFIDFARDLKLQNTLLSRQARLYFGELLTSITELAGTGVDIYSSSSRLVRPEVPTAFCVDDEVMPTFLGPLASMFVTNGFFRTLIAGTPVADWSTLSYWCYSLSNAKEQTGAFNEVFSNFYDQKLEEKKEIWSKIEVFLILFPVLIFCLCVVPPVIILIAFMRDIKRLLPLLKELDPNVRKAAAQSLSTVSDDEESKQTKESKETSNSEHSQRIVLAIFVSLLPIAILIGELFYCSSVNDNFARLHGWLYHGSTRAPYTAEVCMAVVLTILKRNGLDAKFVDAAAQEAMISSKLNDLLDHNNVLLRGKDDLPACYGFDEELDRIHYEDVCTIDDNTVDSHDSYRCASLNQDFVVLDGYVLDLIEKIDQQTNLDSDVAINLFHLTNDHMFQKIMDSSSRMTQYSIEKHSEAIQNMTIFFVCSLVIAIIIVLSMYYIAQRMEKELQGALILVRRVMPQALVQNKRLMDYLLNKDSRKGNFEMTLSSSVIYNAEDGILCLSKSGIIEIVNLAVTKMLGYTPEQLLGQPLDMLIAPDASGSLLQNIGLMRAGQSALTYEEHTEFLTDSEAVMPVHVTVLGMRESQGNDQKDISSMVVILKDETVLRSRQIEAEEAKKQSEHLLYQILPQDIVLRLNQGEKDISFTVPSASIIFIDIVRFSEYAATLTPQEIMGNLATVFSTYDAIGTKYSMFTKIKLIGDVYMAATGLFAPDEPPQTHAEQMLRFGLDCLCELDDVNVKLNSNLAVRIGVNSGGPILAGVLGTDKPVFDIISDTINVASRLQSTDIPGHIQISQATCDLVKDLDFQIEPRGEVFLKGKGNQMAYFVRSRPLGVFKSLSDLDDSTDQLIPSSVDLTGQ